MLWGFRSSEYSLTRLRLGSILLCNEYCVWCALTAGRWLKRSRRTSVKPRHGRQLGRDLRKSGGKSKWCKRDHSDAEFGECLGEGGVRRLTEAGHFGDALLIAYRGEGYGKQLGGPGWWNADQSACSSSMRRRMACPDEDAKEQMRGRLEQTMGVWLARSTLYSSAHLQRAVAWPMKARCDLCRALLRAWGWR